MSYACRFPSCASLVDQANEPCPVHRHYRLASDLEACAGTRCAHCHRKIKKTDWCVALYTFEKNKKKEYHKTYHHALCEPATGKLSKRQQCAAVKPLLADLDTSA